MLILRINSAAFCEEEEKEVTPATELVFNLTLLVFFFFSSTEKQLYFGDHRHKIRNSFVCSSNSKRL